MSRYTVTVFMNVDEDNFFGYKPNHPLATEDDLILTVEATDVPSASDKAFAIGNRMHADAEGVYWPSDVRSVSVGDLIKVADAESMTFVSVDSYGFTVHPEPTNPIVSLAGTRATSRVA
jgi:hypothetical protein